MINFFNLRQEKNDSFYSDHFSPEKRRMRSRDSIGPISVHCHSGYDSRPGGWRSERNRSILIDHWLDQVHCDGPNADWLFWRRCLSREQFYHGPFHVKSGRIVAAGMSRKLSIFSINSAVDRIQFSSGTRRALKFEINSIKNIWSNLWCLTTTCYENLKNESHNPKSTITDQREMRGKRTEQRSKKLENDGIAFQAAERPIDRRPRSPMICVVRAGRGGWNSRTSRQLFSSGLASPLPETRIFHSANLHSIVALFASANCWPNFGICRKNGNATISANVVSVKWKFPLLWSNQLVQFWR